MKGRVQAMLALALGLALFSGAPGAYAQVAPSPPAVGTPEAIAAARAHFTRGRDLYGKGSYREAIVELDAARALDPKAKDLVFNLAIVHEKLAEIDEALRYARLYAEMELEPAERLRAETYIKRLEGAKAELAAQRAQSQPAAGVTSQPGPAPERVRGRIDVATIVVAATAVGAAAAGTVLGIKALADRPSSSEVTGVGGVTLPSEQGQVSRAHTEAVVADVCFGSAGALAVAAAVLYFARYKDAPASAPPPARDTASSLALTPFVGPSLAGLSLGGTF